jgi:hypothetical protein
MKQLSNQHPVHNTHRLNNMKRLFLIFSLFALSATAGFSYAEDVRYYDFEIIIFESLSESGKISEAWKNDVVIEAPENTIELGKPFKGNMPKEYRSKHSYRLLPRKSYRLTEEAKYLSEKHGYRILLHTAWRQPGMDSETSIPIHLYREFIVTQNTPRPPSTTDPASGEIIPADPAVTTEQKKAILDGYLKVVLSRYLHANFDLVYKTGIPLSSTPVMARPVSDGDDDNSTQLNQPLTTSYHLTQTRKMRSKEVHYIDHPVLGILILAWPYETD